MVFDMSQLKLTKDVLIYIFYQYRILCKAHKLEIQKYKCQLQGKGSYLLIECFLDKQNHLKTLLKKISQNTIIQESF